MHKVSLNDVRSLASHVTHIGITPSMPSIFAPGLAAAHIIEHAGRAAFVDTGTTHSVPYLLAALEELGIERAAVDFLFLTHVHLDHAGGAGALLQAAAQRARRRCIRAARRTSSIRAKLIAASILVYGEDSLPAALRRARAAAQGARAHHERP